MPWVRIPSRPIEGAVDEFAAIYPRYRDYVFRICSRYTRYREDAEDLTQEVLLKVVGRMDAFRGESGLSTWIYRVAVNHCLDHLRKRRREEKHLEVLLDEMVIRNLDSGGDRVLARIELDRILGRFRPVVRQILFLTLAEGLSHVEAAEVLGMSPAAVSKTVSRFRRKGRVDGFNRPDGTANSRITGNNRGMSADAPLPASNTAMEGG
jgi:RNA polymerase sigma-70 factor (ECF subfamily)